MFRLLFLLFITNFCALPAIAQHTEVDAIRNQVWPNNDPYQDITEVPAKWHDASAVILYQSYTRAYSKKGKTIRNANSLRKRIKIQDNSALQSFSEFAFDGLNSSTNSFRKKSEFTVSEIKVIKANGNSFMINLDEAVESSNGGKKIAISNLEIGDILDYYYYQHDVLEDVHGHAFQPVISTLGEEYPILHQDLSFTVHKNFFVKFNTYNNAPKIKTVIDPVADVVTYSIEDHDRAAEEYIQWFNPNRVLPTIKFQVIQADSETELSALNVFTGFYGAKLKQETAPIDFLDLARRSFSIEPINDQGLDGYVNSKCNGCSNTDQLMLAYYYLRNDRFVDMYEAFSYSESGAEVPISDYGNTIMNDIQFINTMAGYLIQENIDFEILATVPRAYGTIENVLLADEVTYLLKVPTDTGSLFLSRFTTNSEFDKIPFDIQGQEAVAFESTDFGLILKSNETTKIPVDEAHANRTHGTSIVSWDKDNMLNINIDRRSVMTGHNKDFDRADILTIYDIVEEDQKEFKHGDAAQRFAIKRNKIVSFKAALSENTKLASENQINSFMRATAAEYDFEVENYDDAALINTGRWSGPFEYTDRFSTSALVKKAGKNYIFQIGELIGKQMAINERQKHRKHDIHMAFARSFKEDIIVEIPEGYIIEGLDRLNMKAENASGKFISKAYIKDGQLHLSTLKAYNNTIEPMEQWPDLLSFLEAAYELSQEKILLKKTSNNASASLGER